jgi:hypothetical protein
MKLQEEIISSLEDNIENGKIFLKNHKLAILVKRTFTQLKQPRKEKIKTMMRTMLLKMMIITTTMRRKTIRLTKSLAKMIC